MRQLSTVVQMMWMSAVIGHRRDLSMQKISYRIGGYIMQRHEKYIKI